MTEAKMPAQEADNRTPLPRRALACCYRKRSNAADLMLVRTRKGRWTLPGGKVIPGESPWQAAAREAREEAGVIGDIDVEPIAWVALGKEGRSHPHREDSLTPVFLLPVHSTVGPDEHFRDPQWWPLQGVERALRQGRLPWSARWLIPASRAAIDEIVRR
jgi:8-oxo-dGTP pyrophosphatase MutT (NUDIX family)